MKHDSDRVELKASVVLTYELASSGLSTPTAITLSVGVTHWGRAAFGSSPEAPARGDTSRIPQMR